jgi:hypothetical protein
MYVYRQLKLYLETIGSPFEFVANDAFALSVNIMKPYAGHSPGSSLPVRIFNYRHTQLLKTCLASCQLNSVFFQNQSPQIPTKLKQLF